MRACACWNSVMGVPGLWIGNPWAHRWRVRGQGAAARRIDHPERCEQGGYRRVRRGSARRSYPLHFRLSRARPRWLPEGSIHHGGRTGAARGCGGLSDGAEREGAAGTEAPSDTRKGMGGGIWVRFGEETLSLPWRPRSAGAGSGPSVAHRQVAGVRIPRCLATLSYTGGAARRGERVFTPALGRGVLSVGPAPGPSGVTQARAVRASWGRPEERPYFISPRC